MTLSLDENWSVKEDPITEVVLVFSEGRVIAAYTPKVFEANSYLFPSTFPSLKIQRIQLNTAWLKDLVL